MSQKIFNISPAGLPDAVRYRNENPEYARYLFDVIDKPQQWVADRLGISARQLRTILTGYRIIKGVRQGVSMSYSQQYALECLARSRMESKIFEA